jgi:tetratricopeptide (TPR) repeat protein
MVHALLLARQEFTRDGTPVPAPTGRALEVLVYLASSPDVRAQADLEAMFGHDFSTGLEGFADDLEFTADGVRYTGSSDVNAYHALGTDLKALSKLRGEFCPGLISSNPAFQSWLEGERFSVRRAFLGALLQHAAGLEEQGRTAEGARNLEYVMREHATLEPPFAALLSLDLARYHWRLNRVQPVADLLEAALPNLQGAMQDQARVNLGAALVRLGRCMDAVTVLGGVTAGESLGWARVHRANARRFTDDLEGAVLDADAAYRLAAADEDGFLAVAALCVKGEALLERALETASDPKDAVIAFGKAFGITEMLGEDSSAPALAGLAHAHAAWGNQQKALDQGEKAFKRARAARDGSGTVRALLALYATTRVGSFARNALTESRAYTHKPLELRAMLAVLEKDLDATLALEAVALAQHIGSTRLEGKARRFLPVESAR